MTTIVRVVATKAADTNHTASIATGAVRNFIAFSLEKDDPPIVIKGKTGTTTGADDGAGNAAFLTDTTADWGIDQWIGYTLANTTDGSTTTVTSNTENTIIGTLSGGTDDDWDNADVYTLDGFEGLTFKGEDGEYTRAEMTRGSKTTRISGPVDIRIDKPVTQNAVQVAEYT